MIEDYCPFLGHEKDCMGLGCHFYFYEESDKWNGFCGIRNFLREQSRMGCCNTLEGKKKDE